MKFVQVVCVPAQAIFPPDFFESEADSNEPTLVGVTANGCIFFFDQVSGKWEPR